MPKFFCAHCPYNAIIRKTMVRHLQKYHLEFYPNDEEMSAVVNNQELQTENDTVNEKQPDIVNEEEFDTVDMRNGDEDGVTNEEENDMNYSLQINEEEDDDDDTNVQPYCTVYYSENEGTNDEPFDTDQPPGYVENCDETQGQCYSNGEIYI